MTALVGPLLDNTNYYSYPSYNDSNTTTTTYALCCIVI